MAERLSLELELLDKVGAPAKRAAAALRGIEQQQKKTQDTINKFADSWRRIGDTATKARDKESAALRKMGLAQLEALKMNKKYDEELKKAQHSHNGFLSSFKHALPFRSIGDYFKGAFWGHLAAEGVEKIAEGFVEGAEKAVELLYDGIKEAFNAIAHEQQRIAGYDLTLGKHGSREAREDIERFSKQTAFSASQNQDMMLPLFRAGLKDQAARTAYAAALDLAAGRGKGADQEAVSSAVELFARIQQKGAITSKQLAGVGLGEFNLPAFYKDLGKQLHISAKEAEKRAAQPGGVDPALLRDRIYAAIERQQGGKLGTGAERAGKELLGQWNKLKSLPEEFFNQLAKSPALPRLSAALGNILKQLDPHGPTGARILGALEETFNKLTDMITEVLTPQNVDKFAKGITEVLDSVKKLPGFLSEVWKYSKLIAEVWAGMKVISIVNAVGNVATGGNVAGGLAKKAVGGALASPVGAVAALGLGLNYAVSKQQEQTQAIIDKYNNEHYVDEYAAKYFGTGYAREHKATFRRGQMQIVQNINVGDVNVNAGNDPTHTGQKAGVAIADSMNKHLGRAVSEAGAQ